MPKPVPTRLSTKAVMTPTRAPSHHPTAPPTVAPIRAKSLDMSLSRPQPSERARREERVDQPVYRCLGRRERSEEHTSELQSRLHLVCRLLLEKKKKPTNRVTSMHHQRSHV